MSFVLLRHLLQKSRVIKLSIEASISRFMISDKNRLILFFPKSRSIFDRKTCHTCMYTQRLHDSRSIWVTKLWSVRIYNQLYNRVFLTTKSVIQWQCYFLFFHRETKKAELLKYIFNDNVSKSLPYDQSYAKNTPFFTICR